MRCARRRHVQQLALDQLDLRVVLENSGLIHAQELLDIETRRCGRENASD
jgi:hypothetical protein